MNSHEATPLAPTPPLGRRPGGIPVLILLALAYGSASLGATVPESGATAAAELRAHTQQLLDAIAPGDVSVWDRYLDPEVIQVDENDVVRGKAEILAELQPLGPGLVGHLKIDAFRAVVHGELAVVTHEDDETLDYHGQLLRSRFRNTDTWQHTPRGWRLLGSQVLAVLQDPPGITLDQATLCAYAGRYALSSSDISASIRCDQDRLIFERSGRPARAFKAEVKDVFFEPGQPRTRRIFSRDAHGRVSGFVDRREARDLSWQRLD